MPFRVGDDVFVVSKVDTGEVIENVEREINKIRYDVIIGNGDHHEDDLRPLPLRNERIYKRDFFFIVSAERRGDKRCHETKCIRNGRGRIF